MAAALFITGDLMFASRAAGAAQQQGVTLETAGQVSAAVARCQHQPFELVILDLTLPGLDPAELVSQLRASANPPAKIIAYAPHVHEARLAAAAQAGCDRVLSRGQFSAQLDALLAETIL